MNSDNVYMIDDDGQVVLIPVQNNEQQHNNQQWTTSDTNFSTTTPQRHSFNNVNSQVNPVIVQTQPVTQPSVRQVSANRMRNSVRYTQSTQSRQNQQLQSQSQVYQRPQVQPQQQPQPQVYQRPQVQQQVYQRPQPQQQVYQRPQPQPQQQPQAPLLNNRVLNTQKQEDSLSYNNWKKMNLSLTQMVSNNNIHTNAPVIQNVDNTNDVDNINNEELTDIQQEFVHNSNRAKNGTFINNNSYSNRNYSTINSKNIPSYLAIRKAHNSESIYL